MALTNNEVDMVLCDPIKQLVVGLTNAGRSPRQAIQDIRRMVNRLEVELDGE